MMVEEDAPALIGYHLALLQPAYLVPFKPCPPIEPCWATFPNLASLLAPARSFPNLGPCQQPQGPFCPPLATGLTCMPLLNLRLVLIVFIYTNDQNTSYFLTSCLALLFSVPYFGPVSLSPLSPLGHLLLP